MGTSRRLRIAIFNADVPVPKVFAKRGHYSDIFERLLRSAAAASPAWKDAVLEFPAYDVMKGALPTEDESRSLNGIVITGSSASAYDSYPWISTLGNFLHYTYYKHPYIHLFGSCFGHQLLCQAILTPLPSASCVSQDPNGWELGIHAITLNPAFLSSFGPVSSNRIDPSQLRLQFVHHDHVVMRPSSLPVGWLSIGHTEHCVLQGVYHQGRVLTYQGHFEFDEFVNGETLKVFGQLAGWDVEETAKAVESSRGEDDSVWAAGVVVQFMLEEPRLEEGEKGRVMAGNIQQGCAKELEVEMEGLRTDERVGQTVM